MKKRTSGNLEGMMLPESFPKSVTEYLVVTDKTSKVLKSTSNYYEAVKLANLVRRGGGEVTVFKATRA